MRMRIQYFRCRMQSVIAVAFLAASPHEAPPPAAAAVTAGRRCWDVNRWSRTTNWRRRVEIWLWHCTSPASTWTQIWDRASVGLHIVQLRRIACTLIDDVCVAKLGRVYHTNWYMSSLYRRCLLCSEVTWWPTTWRTTLLTAYLRLLAPCMSL